MRQISYGEFSAGLHARAAVAQLPLAGSVELTHRCSLDCEHCYNNLPMSDRGARHRELSATEWGRVLAEISDAGGMYLLLTGGEVFARKDFLEVYAHAKRLGFLVTIFTNGTLLTPRIADALAASRPFSIELTLYGATPTSYERLTGIRGSYERAHRGLQLLKERALPLRLKTVGVTHTAGEMTAMREFAERELGTALKFDSMINGRIDGGKRPLATRLPAERIVELDIDDPVRRGEWQGFVRSAGAPRPSPPPPPPAETADLYHCGGGVSSYAIDPEGRLSICVLSKRDQFDLRLGTFKDGWSRYVRAARAKQAKRETKCTRCTIKSLCGMCPAMGELESGDAEEPVNFLCEVAHLRAAALGVSVPAHGDCEFCAGGERHEEAAATLQRIQARPASARSTRSLPLVQEPAAAAGGCSTGGACASCG